MNKAPPSVVVLSPRPAELQGVRRACGRVRADCRVIGSPTAELDVPPSRVAAVVFSLPDHPGLGVEHLRIIRARFPAEPKILLTAAASAELRALAAEFLVGVCDPSHPERLESLLRAALARRRRTWPAALDRLAQNGAPRLAKALRDAFAGPNPPLYVNTLARRVGVDRDTLERELRTAVGAREVRLKHLLDVALLYRAVLLHRRKRSWAKAAEALGVGPNRVAAIRNRVAARRGLEKGDGESPSEVSRYLWDVLFE